MAVAGKAGIKENTLPIFIVVLQAMYNNFFKQVIDRTIALILLVLLSPVFVILIIIIKFSSAGAIFFIHQRPGLNGKPFFLLKFKTMNEKCDQSGKLLPNVQRITKIGSFLRKSSLDEIPQLINVLKGDLSLVGPRPLEMRYLPYYTPEQNRRHSVKPGITGWAQINGRNSVTWEEKFKLDVWYVDHISFILDLKILLNTFLKVIKREGVNSDAQNTVIPLDVYLKSKGSYNSY